MSGELVRLEELQRAVAALTGNATERREWRRDLKLAEFPTARRVSDGIRPRDTAPSGNRCSVRFSSASAYVGETTVSLPSRFESGPPSYPTPKRAAQDVVRAFYGDHTTNDTHDDAVPITRRTK